MSNPDPNLFYTTRLFFRNIPLAHPYFPKDTHCRRMTCQELPYSEFNRPPARRMFPHQTSLHHRVTVAFCVAFRRRR